MRIHHLIISMLMSAASSTWAASLPVCLPAPDQRLCYADYNDDDVTLIEMYPGFVTLLEFQSDEQVIDALAGIPAAYEVVRTNNAVALRIKEAAPPSNLIINTSKRIYFIDLTQAKLPQATDSSVHLRTSQTYRIRWRYPADTLESILAKNREKKQREEKDAAAAVMAAKEDIPTPSQFSTEGDSSVCPRRATVRGLHTVAVFDDSQDIPSIYQVDEQGAENLVPRSMINPRTVSIHIVAKRLVFRRALAVCTLFNESLMSRAK